MSDELKPCPFCKREAQQTASSGLVSCAFENCPAFLLAVPAGDWNRRAQPAEAEGVEAVAVVKHDSPLPGYTDFMKYEQWMADGLSGGWEKLMTVAQHERIVAALTRRAQTEQQPVVDANFIGDVADSLISVITEKGVHLSVREATQIIREALVGLSAQRGEA